MKHCFPQSEEGVIKGTLNIACSCSNLTARCSCLVIQLRSPKRKVRKNKKFNLGSWNIRTLQDNDPALERKTALISLALRKYNVSICALSETRFAGTSQLEEVGGGYVFYWIGKDEEEHRQSGVGFAIRSDIAKSLTSLPKGVNDRIMTLTLDLENESHVTLISCYAPTMSCSEQEIENFYDKLRSVVSNIPYGDKLVLMGDFNARVGNDHLTWPGVLGPHGVGKMNSNGLRLLSFCQEFNLCITNTVSQQPNRHKTTWMHPRSKDWHQIDYIITKKRDLTDFYITRSFHSTGYLSDHALLRSKISLQLPRKRRLVSSNIPKRINVLALKVEGKKEELSEKLASSLDSVEISNDVEASWKSLRDVIYSTSFEVLGLPKRKHQDWFDENNSEVQLLIDKMHDSHKCWLNDKSSSSKKLAYKRCKGVVQKSLRQMKEFWWSAKAAELQEAANRKDSKAFYEGLKKVYGPKENGTSPVLSSDGETLHTDKKEILSRWKEHFEHVLNSDSLVDGNVIDSIPQKTEIPQLSYSPSLKEVQDSIKQMSSGKAPGNDGIPPEVYKFGGRTLSKKLLELYLLIWTVEGVPQDYKDASIRHLFKNKGKKVVCDNWRGISLLSIAGKILARIILNRIITYLVDDIYPESQCGFRAGRGTVDMIFSLRQVAEKVREKNQELYMVFVDLTKAFDTVDRDSLWKVLKKLGIPDNMLNIIISFHKGMKASVLSDGQSSDVFDVTNGTKQGCVMAPVLFALYFSLMLKHAYGDLEKGVQFEFRTSGGLHKHTRFQAKTKTRMAMILDLLFADDAALVATSLEEAQELIDRFSAASKAFGLTISIKKTEVVHQPKPTPKQKKGVKQQQPVHKFPSVPITVDEKNLKYVRSFEYLGSKVNSSASLDDEIVNRISKASNAFGKLRHRLWNERGISIKTKVGVYRAVVLTTLLYGSESWTPYRAHIDKLDIFHKRCLRTICGYTLEDHITNSDIFKKCSIGGIESFLIQSQLRWVGHVVRMEDSRIPKVLLYSQLQSGARNVGRPLLRYKDKLKYNLEATNIPIASFEQSSLNRIEWRSACHEGITKFERDRLHHLEELRLGTKARSLVPISPSVTLFKCPICHLMCKSKAGLKSHTRHKHQNPEPVVVQVSQSISQSNQFACTLCNMSCKSKAGLMAHTRHKHKN